MLKQKTIKIEESAFDYVTELAKDDDRSFNYIVNKILVLSAKAAEESQERGEIMQPRAMEF